MNDCLPWEVHPGLTEDRLLFIARVLAGVRDRVRLQLQPEEGDLYFGQWVSGTQAHARTAYEINRLAESGDYPWLEIVDRGMQFTFKIDGVPIRIFRGEPEKPTRSAQKKGVLEAMHQLMLFEHEEMGGKDLEWQWRIALEVEPESGEVFRITLVQVNVTRGVVNVRNAFPIPFRDSASALTVVATTRRDGVELPAPQIGELTAAEELAKNLENQQGADDADDVIDKDHGTDG